MYPRMWEAFPVVTGPWRTTALLSGTGLELSWWMVLSVYHSKVLSSLPEYVMKQIHRGEVAFLQGPCTPSPWLLGQYCFS